MVETIGAYLKKLRQGKGMTLRQLEKKSGISNSYISQIENKNKIPTIEAINKLAYALGESSTQSRFYSDKMIKLVDKSNSKIDWQEIDKQHDWSGVIDQVRAIENGEIELDSPKYQAALELSDTISFYESKLAEEALHVDLNKAYNKEITFTLDDEELSTKESEALKLFLEGLKKLRTM
ncbi:helix-turn-helix transcriptional regulator [Listeria booriae]|uniref:helix-turn-helix domain-containing protein n=1 Tax=Listeria booriae TaxID=1552123 RepID=UPI00164E823F|nr:helix-turn-helix transcriptional regulator [Listeria booriae]MBC6165746.1 helix-turn-helix transcriptional regulator [Listeria booriae]